MVYDIDFESFTKINESAGTIQNVGDYAIEMSESPVLNNGILLLPNQKATFSNTDIYVRCAEESHRSEIRIVPFIVDAKGGGNNSAVDSAALKSVTLDGNTLKFFASTDTTQSASYTFDIPAEQFLDQVSTKFVPNFMFSAILYEGATNPNLNGKPVLVLGVKTRSNDGVTTTISYSFLDMTALVDVYTASDTSVIISDYKVKANVSTETGNMLATTSNGLYVDGSSKIDKVAGATAGNIAAFVAGGGISDTGIDLSNYVEKDGSKVLSTNDYTTAEKSKLAGIAANANNYTYTLPAATSSVLGGVKVGSNITNSSGTISISKSNVTSALGYTPPTANTTYSVGTTSALGLTKLYTGTGNNTDGTMTQGAINIALSNKLDSNANAVSASKLNTSQNFITNLASTSAGSFNGTASVSAGVTGTLPVANGGTGKTTLEEVTVGAATKDGDGNVITGTYVTKTELDKRWNIAGLHNGKRYGYRIRKDEADPYERVEYILDAVGMTPAHMDFTNGVFDYGSWESVWFVTDNRPCMLKSDGTVDYYLNPNNYEKKLDGTASDVANTAYDGNAMAQIPLCWVKRYEDENYLYAIVSNVQYDSDYKAYAHTRADGTIADYFFAAMFGASGNATKLRSLSGQTLAQNLQATQHINGATANGTGWYIESWSRRELIRTLLVLMGKSTNTQSVFGNGNGSQASSASGLLQTGTLKDKGQFYGYNTNNQQVKVFHIEGFWGDQWNRTAGFINSGGKIYVKMTPEGNGYRVTDTTGYIKTNISTPAANPSYISQMSCSEYGMIPTAVAGSGSTYFCDVMWSNNSQLDYVFFGGGADLASAVLGAFSLNLAVAPSYASWNSGCALSFA